VAVSLGFISITFSIYRYLYLESGPNCNRLNGFAPQAPF
jgi:hypothetical protein